MLVVFGKRILDRLGTPAGASLAADIAAIAGAEVGDGADAAVAPGVAGSLHGHVREAQENIDLVYARQGAPAGASQSADVAAIKVVVDAGATASALAAVSANIGTPVNAGGAPTLAAILGDFAAKTLVARLGSVSDGGLASLAAAIGTGGEAASAGAGTGGESLHSKLRWIMANGGGASQASVDAIAADLGDMSATWPTLGSLVAYLGTLPDVANAPLGTLAMFGFNVFKISAVTSDTSFTIAAAATGCPSPLPVLDTYANQIIYKIGGSAAVGAAGMITTSSGGLVLTLSGGGLASATVGDRVMLMPHPNMVGKSGDSTSLPSPTVHAKIGTGGSSALEPSVSTNTLFGAIRYTYERIGSWAGNSNLTSLKLMFNHAGWDNSATGIGTALAMGSLKVYTTASSGSGVFTLTAVGSGPAVPTTADCLRGARFHILTGSQAGRTLWCHSYSTGGVVRHDMTGTSIGNTVYLVVEPAAVGARKMATWHPWDLPAVMVTQATDIAAPDQAVAVTQTTTSATYVVLDKKTWTAADAPLALDWIKANRLVWTSDMSNAGTGETKWYISPESATETVNTAPSGSAVAISDGIAAAAAATTHYLNAISPVLTSALPANGGFHLLLAGKADGAETLTCTVLASSYLTIG